MLVGPAESHAPHICVVSPHQSTGAKNGEGKSRCWQNGNGEISGQKQSMDTLLPDIGLTSWC